MTPRSARRRRIMEGVAPSDPRHSGGRARPPRRYGPRSVRIQRTACCRRCRAFGRLSFSFSRVL